jgi:hypothetical protein
MRCQISSAQKLVLLLTSFFLFFSCGIPTFLDLDQHITLTGQSQNDNTISITISRQTTADLLSYYEVQQSPSLKLFYVLSTTSQLGPTEYVTEQPGDSTHFPLTDVITHFDALYGMKSGNGSFWSPESQNSAAGLYSYRNLTGVKKYSTFRPDNDELYEEIGGILTGTFSHALSSTGPFIFGTAPEMDVLIPLADGNYEITVSLEEFSNPGSDYPVDKNSYLIKLSDGTDEFFLADYQKNLFAKTDVWTSDDFATQYIDTEDTYFYHNLALELEYATDEPLYIHLFGAVYGGEGNFTNIYWSSLEYLGSMAL